uniref:Uncharacterized protein LOC114343651 n=1 Tax=Diabrotica virgifera virgifera TaxID=50390 RepID=A0A6P7H2M4_DIAVI
MTSHYVNPPSDPTTPVNQSSNITNSYASAASHSFPSKTQAIVFSCIDNAKLQYYLVPSGTIINPKNIIFSSGLSHDKICMYLANKTIVDNFMKQHGYIEVLGEVVTAGSLVSPAERLVLSGVCPSIPHQV